MISLLQNFGEWVGWRVEGIPVFSFPSHLIPLSVSPSPPIPPLLFPTSLFSRLDVVFFFLTFFPRSWFFVEVSLFSLVLVLTLDYVKRKWTFFIFDFEWTDFDARYVLKKIENVENCLRFIFFFRISSFLITFMLTKYNQTSPNLT